MNRFVKSMYTMSIFGVGWKVDELLVSKKTGDVFASIVISKSMMKDFLTVPDYIEWKSKSKNESKC